MPFNFSLPYPLVSLILVWLLTLLTSQQLHLYAIAQQGQFPHSIITRTSLSTEPIPLILKAIQDENGKISYEGGFKQDLTNMIVTQNNSQLYIFSSESIEKVKIGISTSKATLDIQKTGFNSFHIDYLPAGIHTLDVVVVKGNTHAAYEGILAMGPITYEELQKDITIRNTAPDETFVFQHSAKLNNQ